jgi:hypothetical protein
MYSIVDINDLLLLLTSWKGHGTSTIPDDVNIVPNITKKQWAEEVKMKEEAEQRNRDLTSQDWEKNMKCLVVVNKGEKHIMKGQEREIISHARRNGEGDRPREKSCNRDWEGRRSGEKDQGREERETGARRKEGVWNRERRDKNRDKPVRKRMRAVRKTAVEE